MERFVAAVDESGRAGMVLRAAQALAGREGEIYAIHAHPRWPEVLTDVLAPYAGLEDDFVDLEAELVGTLARKLVRVAGEVGVQLSAERIVVGVGDEADEALRLGQRVGPALVIMGPAEGGRAASASFQHRFLGSSPWSALRLAPSHQTKLPARLVLGMDFGPGAPALLAEALSWAQRWGATVRPVYVYPTLSAWDHAGFVTDEASQVPGRVRKEAEKRMLRVIEQSDLSFPLRTGIDQLLQPLECHPGDPAEVLDGLDEEAWVVVGRTRGGDAPVQGLGRVPSRLVRGGRSTLLVVATRR